MIKNNALIVSNLLILLLLLPISIFSSVLYTSRSQDTLTVGDRVQFTVCIVSPKGSQIVPPPTENGFGEFTIKDWITDKKEKSNFDSTTFNYVITLYNVKPCSLPALPYLVVSGNKTDTLFSPVLPFRVISVVTTDSAQIKDLRPQQVAGKPSLLWLWILLILCGIGAIIAAIWYWRDKKVKTRNEPPPLPPYEEAMESLKRLENKKYLSKGMVREHTFELSEIFKRYIERRFETNAAEWTAEEMRAWVRVSSLAVDQKNSADWFFATADPVKFARWIPDDRTVQRFIEEVRSFLEATKPKTNEPSVKQAEVKTEQGKPDAAA